MRRVYVGDGGSFVWQWQPKEQIVLEGYPEGYPEGVFVHYANCDTVEAPVVQTRMEGDKLVADIPPELMQVDKDITVYVCDVDGTKHCHFLSVLSRPKPESYVTEPVEVLRYESLAERVAKLEKGGTGGGITEEKDPTVAAWAKVGNPEPVTSINGKAGALVLKAEDVGALPGDTKIPKNTSDLSNDAGFITTAVNDLANYYTKVQMQELIAAIPRFRVTVVQQLPAAGEELVLYLVPFATAEGQYLEYIWADGRWEIIGSQRVDLTGFATEKWVEDYVEEHSGQNVTLDTTLTKSGEAADAKAVGDEIKRVEGLIPSIDGLAKTEDIPAKPEDIGAQPQGNYLTEAPVESVNGKTGKVTLCASDVGARPDTWTPTVQEVGADPTGTAASAVSEHNTSADAHTDLRLEVNALREQLAAFLDVDEETLNELSELIAAIAANQTSIEQLTSGKVNVSDIVNNLVTNVTNKPLSAAQGVELKKLIDNVSASLANYQPKGDYLTEHQSLAHLLPRTELTNAINVALAQAKADGEFDGEDGYTPKRGVDYWNRTDKAEIEAFIASELAKRGQLKPEFANSIEECTDTSKLYVLPDGYIYAYMLIEREVSTGGGYTNLAKTFAEGYRISASSGLSAQAGATAVEDYIPAKAGDVVRIKGFGALDDWQSCTYTESKTAISASKPASAFADGTYSYDESTEIATLTISSSNVRFVRVSGVLTGTTADVIITVNEEITEGGTEIITEYAWANTGHAFVPADYEERIITLEEDVLQLKNTVGTQGGSTGEAVTLPAYWEPEVEAKAAIVKDLQEAGGKNCVSFVHAADLHIDDNDNGRTTDIGKVMAAMLDRCHIPWAVLSGDINTRASYGTEAGLLEAQSAMPEHLAPLWGTNRLLLGLGNHDGCWGDSSGYYRHQFPPERMWDIFCRWQALDSRRVFSDDGLYFYVDNVAQKTRFIVLNSNFGGKYAEDENGWATNNRFGTSCYGQDQLDWLADVALDMPDGYGAVLCAHVPPNITYTVDRAQLIGIINAYNGKSTFTGSYTAGVDGWSNSAVNVDFTAAKGEAIAMFAGHVHGDSIDTTTMSCPIITILSAGASANEAYADTAPTRTPGTATETSFDVVTINRKTRTIYCTRVGAGDDREVSY